MHTDLFDFDLPEHLIALHPASPRDAARLLVVRPSSAADAVSLPAPVAGVGPRLARKGDGPECTDFQDRIVHDLPGLLRPGDAIVVNDTKVIAAALTGVRSRGEHVAKVDFNLIKRVDACRWRAFARPAKRLQVGDHIRFGGDGRVCLAGTLEATVAAKGEAGEVELAFSLHGAYLDEVIANIGDMPLPPYIALKRPPDENDRASYQTLFASREGAVAAPTAALHFTPGLVARLQERDITRHMLTLHVGAGTFLPVKAADTAGHVMHAEWGEIDAATAAALNATRARGGRIVAIGTTALRLLESAADDNGTIHPFAGETSIFITPGYRFRAVDGLMTNFHLPRSTLFMLVAAFCGLDVMHAAYRRAIGAGYRFYSYGDASLLWRAA